MFVTKRNGKTEPVSFDKITKRISHLTYGLNDKYVDPTEITQKVVSGVYKGVKTSEIDELTAETAANMATYHPDFSILAGRISTSNLHKNTIENYEELVEILYNYHFRGEHAPLVSKELYDIVKKYGKEIQSFFDFSRDYEYDYFGIKTLQRSYLLKIDKKIMERPQHMLMRVAIGIQGDNLEKIRETYELLSQRYYTHATPTLFNAGTPRPQCSSCFLLTMKDDSIEGIFDTLKSCAKISKYAGGIGLSIHDIRSNNSYIRGTGGTSSGIVPMLQVFNHTARYVDQAGRRKGSIAIYIEPWHSDIEDFLDLKKNHGKEESRARDLFYALWVPDLFMKRVMENGKWSLFCPNEAKGLADVYGEEFEALYEKYEAEGKARKVMDAQELFFKVCESQIETGTPYMCYKDAANRKSNQKNLGTIKSSNLCVSPETMILTQEGYYPISSLKDKDVSVWNGKEWSKTTVRQTGKNQKLLDVNFSNGMSIKCTPYHKFYIETGKRPAEKSIPEIVRASDLKPGMKIIRYNTGVVNDNKNDMFEPYTHGLFCADGTYSQNSDSVEDPVKCSYKSLPEKSYCKRHIDFQERDEISEYCRGISYSKKPIISLYGEKISLEEHISYRSKGKVTTQRGVDKITYSLPLHLDEKFYVPINNSLDSKIRWLEGYTDGDGCVIELNGIKNLQVVSVHKEFLKDIVYMLQTIGITSTFSLSRKKGKFPLPDGKGGLKMYDCNPTYRLNIDAVGLMKLIELGFSPKRLDISEARMPKRINNAYVKIVDVIDNEEYDDTYCFTEPKENKGIFEGVLMGQCCEIYEYTSKEEQAVCNLASINLSRFVLEGGDYDFKKLGEVTEFVTEALNKVIDVNFYPTEETKRSNFRHRPIGIGVQGLADTFIMMGLPFESEEAQRLNRDIFECMYYHSLVSSNRLAEVDGVYSTFEGSPASKGILQFDMWEEEHTSTKYDWVNLKERIVKTGLRNSLLLAPMPTASTAQILGNNESFEPYTSNVYSRRVLAGDFPVVNKHLIKDLIDLGLWDNVMRNKILMHKGSVQYIPEIPDNIKQIYKTVWEISQKTLINMSADRGKYICQSQSFNIHMEDITYGKLSSMHFYGWKKGLKTGMYYLRSRPKVDPIAFTVDKGAGVKKNFNIVCNLTGEDRDQCFSCGS